MGGQSGKARSSGQALLAALPIWGLAFGCVIGWGSFVMPGTTFLPDAGPVGAVIGLALAAGIIAVVAINYRALARRFPDDVSSYAFVKRVLGNDHAFLAVWSLALAYLSLLWANATAFILIGRYLVGDVLQWGFHYTLAGYDIYLGEVLATIVIQTAFGLIVCFARKLAEALRTVFAVGLIVLVVALFVCVLSGSDAAGMTTPPFAEGEPIGLQVLGVAIMAPWLFVGFEIAYQESGEAHLSPKAVSWTALAALLCGALVYILLTLIGAAQAPAGFAGWPDYVANLGSLSGIEGMPVLFNARAALGPTGIGLAAAAVICALSTSVLGFYRAAAHVLGTMAQDGLLPAGLAATVDGVPRRALLLIMVLSLPIPLLGRTAVGWNADVSTLSVAIVYSYISLCAFKAASGTLARVTGAIGLVASILIFFFLLAPNIFVESALATESYFMLAAWSLLGILYYWFVFRRDHDHRFGKSTAMWIMMLFLLLFSSTVWTRLDAQKQMAFVDPGDSAAVADVLMSSSLVQMAIIVIALFIMLNLFSTMLKREKELDLQVIQAEERNAAKTSFLSTMSHDIRTPMNAIVGFTNLAVRTVDDPQKTSEYLAKIQASSDHLLSLINDVLEMSRIESGKMELDEAPMNLPQSMDDLVTIIAGQAHGKHQELVAELDGVTDPNVWCDKLRLNQLVLNLLSNAVKYTPDGGCVWVRLWQDGPAQDGVAPYVISVKDNGIGMTPEFADRVFEAFERDEASHVEGIQGTGLGMAIAKRIVELMGGTIDVETALGEGTEFTVRVPLRVCDEELEDEAALTLDNVSFEGRRLLLVDDVEMNREIAVAVLEIAGFEVETACDGQQAVDAVASSQPGWFDAVLMDVQMPVMNGFEATRAIRALPDPELASIPIIAATANAFEEDRRASLAAGMDGHVTKPIDPDVLVETLAQIIGAPQVTS